MSRHEREPTQKHTLHLYEGDYAELQSLYPETGAARAFISGYSGNVVPNLWLALD